MEQESRAILQFERIRAAYVPRRLAGAYCENVDGILIFTLVQQQSVLTGRGVRIQLHGAESMNLLERSILSSCQVADADVVKAEGENEEAVAGGLQIEAGSMIEVWSPLQSRDALEPVGGGDPCTVVEGDDVQGLAAVGDDAVGVLEGEGGLAGVVGQEEAAGGGGAAPRGANGAAAEDGFGGQPDENLPDGDLVREAGEEGSRTYGIRHDRRPGWEWEGEIGRAHV